MTRKPAYDEPSLDDEEEEEEEEEKEGNSSPDSNLMKKLLDTRSVLLCGPVTEKMSNRAMAQLLILDAMDPERPIKVYINSPGGAVDSGFAIYDTIRFVKAPVYTICAGLAASAATVILLGADKGHRYTLPNTRFLLHQPSQGLQGTASDVAIGAQEILKIRRAINELLSQETGQSIDRIAEDTHRDFWLTAPEAKEYGLVSEIIESASALDL